MLSKLLGIRIFDVEASSRCNLHCRFCPRDALPDEGLMSDETFDRFLENVPLGATDALTFAGIGEPCLNPRLPEFIKRAKSLYPKVQVQAITNGSCLTEKMVCRLMESGLNMLDISFNGTDRESYESMMRGACYETNLENISRTVRMVSRSGSSMRLQINCVVSRGDLARVKRIKSFWKTKGIHRFRIHRLHDRGGQIVTGHSHGYGDPPSVSRCQVFEMMTFVTWRGDVLCCSHDVPRERIIGNVRTDRWADLAERKRSILRHGGWPEICAHCQDRFKFALRREVDRQILWNILERVRRVTIPNAGQGVTPAIARGAGT